MHIAQHPTPEHLSAYLANTLDVQAELECNQHFERCSECCRALEELCNADQSLEKRIRQIHANTTIGLSAGTTFFSFTSDEDRTSSQTEQNCELIDRGERYQFESEMARGGMGIVYSGRDRLLDRGLVLKVLHPKARDNDDAIERFVTEAKIGGGLQHPGIVPIHDLGKLSDDRPFFSMRRIEGQSLDAILADRSNAADDQVRLLNILTQVCQTVAYAHSQNVVHRDLKPQNVMVGRFGEVQVVDWGIAKQLDTTETRASDEKDHLNGNESGTRFGQVLGTPTYMAPEQADLDASPTASWDVYAAGAILYRMLTGYPPYRDDVLLEKLDTEGSLSKRLERYRDSITQTGRPERHTKRRGVDRSLGRIVNRCLAVNPAQRYENVQQIIEDLNRRDERLTRRPLMVLGIVGPLPLLLAASIFGVRTIDRTTTELRTALHAEAFDSNQTTAKYAARNLEGELETYFQLVRSESRQLAAKPLRDAFDNPTIVELLEEIGSHTTSAETRQTDSRDRLLDLPQREPLKQYLQDRLAYYTDSNDSRVPRLATLFVTDARGTIMAIAYDEPVERKFSSCGRNFAYRTYYHGGREDLPLTTPIASIKPLTQTHLSAAFPSTATGLWKVAVSTPIYLSEDKTSPDAVLVATINLGDFELLQRQQSNDQVAVLLEAREGPQRGTTLQHPLMDHRRQIGETLAGEKYQVANSSLDRLLDGGYTGYTDPLATARDGQAYAGSWIAAMQPVRLPQSDDERANRPSSNADLFVLVQYRLEKVLKPVQSMRTTLLTEGAIAVCSVLLVAFALWNYARRVSDVTTSATRIAAPPTDVAETVATE